MKIWIGTSGWSYGNWKNIFYPQEVKRSEWLAYYARKFNSVEINSSFYGLPKLETIKSWYDHTPDDFLFSVKAWNMITHKHKLKNCEDSLDAFLLHIEALSNKCGPILFQLPYSFAKNLDTLRSFIHILPKKYRYTFEFRHPSWWCEETCGVLKHNNIAFCVFELANLLSPKLLTADFTYIRLHGNQGRYYGKYSKAELLEWANLIKAQARDTYTYFDNTIGEDNAIQNAKQLAEMLSD